jgi:DNA polymerase III beta subunit
MASVAKGKGKGNKSEKKSAAVPKVTKTKVALTLDRETFFGALKVAHDVSDSKATMPILGHAHLTASDKSCTIKATDIENYWVRSLGAGATSDVSVCIPLDIVIREIKALDKEITTVELSFEDETVSVNGRCRIHTMPAEDFPTTPKVTGKDMTITEFASKVARVLPAAGNSDTRYTLNSICIDRAVGYLVATDGSRLHRTAIDKVEKAEQLLLPRRSAELIVKHSAGDTFKHGAERAKLSMADGELIVRCVNGTYPGHASLFPKKSEVTASFQSKDFLAVLEGALPLAGDSNEIVLSFNGKLVVEARSSEKGEYKWEIPCKTKGGERKMAFNANYLRDALKAYGQEEAVLAMTEQLAPCVINGDALVMPMRLQSAISQAASDSKKGNK